MQLCLFHYYLFSQLTPINQALKVKQKNCVYRSYFTSCTIRCIYFMDFSKNICLISKHLQHIKRFKRKSHGVIAASTTKKKILRLFGVSFLQHICRTLHWVTCFRISGVSGGHYKCCRNAELYSEPFQYEFLLIYTGHMT